MHFIRCGGRQKSPLHAYPGSSIHKLTKSKTLITILNRLGFSTSYDDILSTKTRLASWTVARCQDKVPLPSHFDPSINTRAAFDNWNGEKTYDTILVLFQDDSSSEEDQFRKPDSTDANIDTRMRTFEKLLKCQELQAFEKPTGEIVIPDSYATCTDYPTVTADELKKNFDLHDFSFSTSRMGISDDENDISIRNDNQTIPTQSPFLSTVLEDSRCKQRIGFLPVSPHPVTEYATVYTSMMNFLDISSQLDQEFLVITCDEGVYSIAMHIKFMLTALFGKLIIRLGDFHLIKIVQACVGKYLKNSGIKDILIETRLFGPNVAEKVLQGSDYAKSLYGFNVIYEAMRRLQLKKFFTKERLEKYDGQLSTILTLQQTFKTNDVAESKQIFWVLKGMCRELLNDFNEHIVKRCSGSELYHYWNNVLVLINLIQILIRAIRTGNFQLLLDTLVEIQPIFHAMDRTNYSRWASIYTEDMLTLKDTAPEVYREFSNGHCSVVRSNIPNLSVPNDQALEASYNRMSKSSGGMSRISEKGESVAVWDLMYHEFLGIFNSPKEILCLNDNDDELQTHREYSENYIVKSETSVCKVLRFLCERNVNPFVPSSHPLINISTEELAHPDVVKQLLNVFEAGVKAHETFRNEQIVTRSKSLSATISKHNLTDLTTIPPCEKKKVLRKILSAVRVTRSA
ncbi:hypothetical protein QAD02_012998 [Eretmocerus hayati]|uniref:Uncharacterized protein n=1 Tax=Eretmocerus hayati TaxID=131215 RepID=A0ACC2P1C0_9HYME|nr:hypothetical protein QAD02_012998 [Eretmocerus hayati]